jgi:DNA mismatch repair protein MutL
MPVPKIEEVVTAYASPSAPRQISWTSAKGSGPVTSLPAALQTPSVCLPVLRILGQLLSSYIIAEGPDGLYLIDQHAAHERILLEVNPKQAEVLKSHYENLAEFGFSIEPFGDRTYIVRTVPVMLHNKDWAGMLRQLLDSLSEGDRTNWVESAAMSMACHSAVRAGQTLTDDEMRELVRQLEQTALPHTCPHGRPTMIHLSSGQLEKEFGRS